MCHRRIVLYSHDAMGIGHLRRNLLIAEALARSEARASVLLVAGVSEATHFKLPPRVDVLALPALRKHANGYESRRLDLPTAGLVTLRAETIRAAVTAFKPDVLVVDKLPRGVAGELEPTLRALLRDGCHTRCVLGLRDVLDDPNVVRAEWARGAYEQALERYYDAVWVYGDPGIYDTVREYSFSPSVAAKTRYTGYLDRPAVAAAPASLPERPPRTSAAACARGEPDPVRALGLPPGRRLALCMLGGGEDGAQVAEAFVGATLPDDMVAVLLTGPFMPPDVRLALMRRAGRGTRRRVVEFLPEPCALLRRADSVVTMGGYNSVCEVLFAHKRALVIPRVRPRLEQWIRAQRLHELGLLDVLHPDALNADAIAGWLSDKTGARRGGGGGDAVAIDFGGLARLPELLAELLSRRPSRRHLGAAASVAVSPSPQGLGAVPPPLVDPASLGEPQQGGVFHAQP